MQGFVKLIKNGIFQENAVFALVLGLCPALAVTTNAANGIGMGLALMFVLVLSEVIISLVKDKISPRVRIPVFLVVVSAFVTITDMILKAYFPALAGSLGVFVALIVVNCIVLGRIEVFASKNTPSNSLADGIGIAIGFMIALTAIGSIREILGDGKILGFPVLLSMNYSPMIMAILPPGGFITIGLLMGFIAWLQKRQALSDIAKSKGARQQYILPEEPPDDIAYADSDDKEE